MKKTSNKRRFPSEATRYSQIDAMQRNWLTYEFQIAEEDHIIPLQKLCPKPDFTFSISFKIFVATDISIITIFTVAQMIEALYPKCKYEWATVVTESVKPGYVVVSLVESI